MDSMCEHGPGHSEVLYDGPSNRVVSVGADSAMVLRDAATGEEVNLCVDEHDYTPIRALALSPAAADYTPQLITGCESGTIRVFSFPGLQFKSNLARFDAPVRQLAYSADGKLVAAVAEDSSVVQLFDAATEQPKCKLHKHAHHVRSVSFDPSGRYLASTGGDGAVAVWDVSKTLSNEMAAAWSSAKLLKDAKATPETHLHRVAWRADGAALAVPLGKEVTVLSPGRGWGERVRLRGARDAHAADITVLAWSPSGRYLASGDVAGKIVVWDVDSARPLDSRVIQPDVPLCSIGWDPNRNSLVVSNRHGTVIQPWTGVVPPDMPAPYEACMPSAVLAPPPSQSAKPAANTKPSMVDSEAGEGNGAEEDEEDELDKQLDGLSGGEEDDEELPDTSQLEGGADRFASVLMNIEDRARMQARQDDGRSSSYHDDSRMMVAETPVQPPFTSGCTPLEDGRRQLGWSLVGRASCVERTDHSSIEIEFEDSSRHRRPLQFIDPERCTMGDIGETGALFASPQRGNSMSQLHFRFFDSWDSEGWTCDLDDGEEIVACAFGRQFVVVATSLRNLRVFNLGGTQVFIVATDGAVVSLACSEWDQLAVVTHAGRGLPTEQNLAVEIWDLPHKTGLGSRAVALSPGETTLTWLGFASNGLLASCDSQGVVRAMVPGWNYRWTPIAHLGKEASEHEKLAVIGVVLKPDFQHVLCVPYKKARKHPVVLPKPLPKIVAATLDLKDSGGYGAPLQLLIKQQMLVQAEKLAENHGDYDGANAMRTGHDMSLAKLVMQLIKHDQAAKALALCEFANNRVMMYNTAAKVANAFNKSLLLERIQRKQKQLREEDEVGVGGGGVMEEEEPTQPRYQPPSRQSPKTTPGPSQSTEHQAEEAEEEEGDEQEEEDGELSDHERLERAATGKENEATGREEQQVAPSDSDSEDDDIDAVRRMVKPKVTKKRALSTVSFVSDEDEDEDEEEDEDSGESQAKPAKKKQQKQASKKRSKKDAPAKSKAQRKKGMAANPFAATPAVRNFFPKAAQSV